MIKTNKRKFQNVTTRENISHLAVVEVPLLSLPCVCDPQSRLHKSTKKYEAKGQIYNSKNNVIFKLVNDFVDITLIVKCI